MELNADPSQFHDQYIAAQPFPHIVLDQLFSDEILDSVLAEFPGRNELDWASFDNPREKKLGLRPGGDEDVPEDIRRFLWSMGSPPILKFLEQLTGIEGLIPDPYLGGGGLHQIERGGFLKIHSDFNWHPKLRLDRRLNLLIYLNRDWREDFGGHLELWDREMKHTVQTILPCFNRTVIFSTTDTSYHGHPTPLTCPAGWSRKSASFYYYTAGRPEEERSEPHDTVFRKRSEEEW